MTMIEKMARAMARVGEPDNQYAEWRGWVDEARVALAVLQEPSSAMLEEGVAQLEYDEDGGLIGGSEQIVERVFVAMLKAAG